MLDHACWICEAMVTLVMVREEVWTQRAHASEGEAKASPPWVCVCESRARGRAALPFLLTFTQTAYERGVVCAGKIS